MRYFDKTLFLLFVASTGAVLQQFELFTELNQRGNSVTLGEKIPDLKDWKFFLAGVKSYCVTGHWNFFQSENYTGIAPAFAGVEDGGETPRCNNRNDFGSFGSVRYLGPRDTRTKAITIYEGTTSYGLGGEELVVTGRAQTNFPMNQISRIILYGNSNWTVFNMDNFQGNSTQVNSLGKLYTLYVVNSTFPVRSVLLED